MSDTELWNALSCRAVLLTGRYDVPVQGPSPVCLAHCPKPYLIPQDDSLSGHVIDALPTSTQPIRKQERAYVIQARGTLVSHRGHVHTLPGLVVTWSIWGWWPRFIGHLTWLSSPTHHLCKYNRPLPISTDQMFKHGRQFNQWTLLSLGWGSGGVLTEAGEGREFR